MGLIVLGVIAILEMDFPIQEISQEQHIRKSSTITPVINEVKVLDVKFTSLTLGWTLARDQAEVSTYKIFKDTSTLATVSSNIHMYKVIGLKPDTWYQFSVEACSASNNCGNNFVGVKTLSAQEATESIINEVNNLVSTRVLSEKQGDALITELAYVYQLNKDNPGAVVNHLRTSINIVNSLINSGILSPEVGQSMVDNLNDVIENI